MSRSHYGISLLLLFVVGCTTSSVSTTVHKSPPVSQPVSINEIEVINGELSRLSSACNLLYAEGTITLSDGNNGSESGQFTLRSKRPSAGGDSLSLEINGPFGITAAKFLGSNQEFSFYNAIEGDHYHGKPDEKTLQQLTGMNGLSLSLLNNVVYGLAPMNLSDTAASIATMQSVGNGSTKLTVSHHDKNYSEAVTFSQNNSSTRVVKYERWNAGLDSAALSQIKPDLSVNFSGVIENSKFLLPNYITAHSGSQTLEIEYSSAKENQSPMTVKIKVPQ